jgi:hypothetical protein
MTIRPEFNSPRPLDEEQLHRMAPSIFAYDAHPSRSGRFRPIATIEVVRALAGEGFLPFSAGQSRTRTIDRAGYTKHMLRFRKPSDEQRLRVGDSIMETVLVNANDGTSGYTLDAGVFKVACLNGLVVKSRDFGSVRVRHTGDVVRKVLEGTQRVMQNVERVMRAPDEWSRIMLDSEQQLTFARAAHALRFGAHPTPVSPVQLLQPRRVEDEGRDLWRIFNVVQENSIAGGLSGRMPTASRISTTRAVRSIGANVHLNQGLWELAETLAKEAA